MSLKCTHQGCNKRFKHCQQRHRHQVKCTFPAKIKIFKASGSHFICSKCDNKFSTRSNVNRHFKTCTGEKSSSTNVHECSNCQKEFSSSWLLKRHETNNCSNEPKFKCEKCDKAYKRIDHFEDHIKGCYISVTATANLGTSSATDLDDTDMSLPSMTPLVANSWHDSVYNSENDMQDQFTILDDQDSSPSRVRATPLATTMVAQSFVESAQTEESDLVNILMNCRLGEGVINYLKQFVPRK